ncbi:hypothetical protein JM654_13865 [Microbacterium oxydans]|nr:hypothetical protein [Microbacterium oxydans]
MDRQQLHDAGFRRLRPRHELVRALRLVEPGQQTADAPPVVGGEEGPDLVGERAQLRRGDPGRPSGLVRRQLDVQPQFELDQADQLRDRLRGRSSQTLQHLARGAHACPPVRGDRFEQSVVVVHGPDHVDGVDDRHRLVGAPATPRSRERISSGSGAIAGSRSESVRPRS